MKNFFVLFLALFAVRNARAQPPSAQHMISTVSNVPTSELFKDKRTFYFYDESYMIDGRRVLGSPFLFHEWNNGVITTSDGRMFTTYKLKYNVYNQSVYFSNGVDSLEVNDEIKEFTIVNVYPDTVVTSRFVNSNQYKKEKKPLYYEVLLDNAAGLLLKSNKKIVAESSEGIPAYEGKKIFRLETALFYFDKSKKLISPVKANGSNIVSLLSLDENSKSALQPEATDFSIEANVIRFFQQYFDIVRK